MPDTYHRAVDQKETTLEWLLPMFQRRLTRLGYRIWQPPAPTILREINAAAALALVVESEGFLGSRGSQFSHVASRLRGARPTYWLDGSACGALSAKASAAR